MKRVVRFNFYNRWKGYGAIFLRILVSSRLIYGVQDNILSWDRMVEFEHFLAARGTPFPLAGAIISVYVQFIGGVLILLGAATRPAAALLIVNFIAALVIAHRGDTFVGMYQALTILLCSVYFLLDGPGRLSIDNRWKREASNRGLAAKA